MNNKIEKSGYYFKEKGHIHYLNGQKLTGITTVLNKVIAKPFLIQWAADMAVDYIENNMPVIDSVFKKNKMIKGIVDWQKYHQICDEARKAHRIKKEKAGDIGTLAHQYISQYIKTKETPEIKEPQIKKMFDNFLLWSKSNKVKFLESEKHLYSEKHFLGGVCDSVAEIDGQKWLVDFKTGGARIYKEAFWQMGGYEICLNEMGEHKDINGYLVLGIFKDGSSEEKRSISNEDNKQAFLSALTLYRLMSKIERSVL